MQRNTFSRLLVWVRVGGQGQYSKVVCDITPTISVIRCPIIGCQRRQDVGGRSSSDTRLPRPLPPLVTKQEHSEGLSSRLREREEELSDAAVLMSETKNDLKRLRDQVQETNQASPCCIIHVTAFGSDLGWGL